MDEVQEHERIASSATSGRGTVFLLICAVAATIALCGWNMRSTSSGPTSVTIVGLNGPAAENESSAFGMVVPAELAANR
jgi:hypothetical protein